MERTLDDKVISEYIIHFEDKRSEENACFSDDDLRHGIRSPLVSSLESMSTLTSD